jgi:hypothetical protein
MAAWRTVSQLDDIADDPASIVHNFKRTVRHMACEFHSSFKGKFSPTKPISLLVELNTLPMAQ